MNRHLIERSGGSWRDTRMWLHLAICGVLLLLAVQDRRDRLEVGYGLEPILPDGRVGGILR